MRVKAGNSVFWYLLFVLLLLFMDGFLAKIMALNERVRSARFAGTWYPSQNNILDKNLTQYLKVAKTDVPPDLAIASRQQNAVDEKVLALIVPHAGYAYSGQTAAYAYQSLIAKKYRRVFILGPSHHIPFRGVVLSNDDAFQTPLGQLPVDKYAVQALLKKANFTQSNDVFDTEHSLEMQLPWIRKVLGPVKIVPMAVGIMAGSEIESIAKSIKELLNDDDLLIVSSDFTHYGPRFEYEPFGDSSKGEQTMTKIKDLDMQAFSTLKTLDSEALLDFYSKTGDTICGIYPAALLLAILPAESKIDLAKYNTSQEFEKPPSNNSVSYMAIVFTASEAVGLSAKEHSKESPLTNLSQSDGLSLIKLAQQALKDHLHGEKKSAQEYCHLLGLNKECFNSHRGVFVTLYKHPAQKTDGHPREAERELRGCVGYIYPNKTLVAGVCDNTINAACADPRFDPVTLAEFDSLSIEVSVLTPPHSITDWRKIELGKDGIVMHKAGRQSVFLPKVATEFNWDLPQTLSQLSLKAGLGADDWQKGARFEIFQSQTFSK